MSEKEPSTSTVVVQPVSESLASHYALRVALQTMRDRCQSLQQRLTTVEEENLTLRMRIGMDKPNQGSATNDHSEMEQLRSKIGELTRQKFQLSEHIAMVATENRQLWSRLSKLTKDNQSLGMSLNKMKDSLNGSVVHQNLIRSKTFTQNSPNPMLRQRFNADLETDTIQIQNVGSLDNISLKELNEFIDEPIKIDPLTNPGQNSLGFGYLNDETCDVDLQNDTKKCADAMVDVKKELLKQQSDLKVALSSLRQRKEICLSCRQKQMKPKTADKNLETDDLLLQNPSNDLLFNPETNQVRDNPNPTNILLTNRYERTNHVDIIEQKRIADAIDKMCPMCGQVYSSVSTFDEFQDHVESHFIDDSELDMSIEKNYEFVSHTVGNF